MNLALRGLISKKNKEKSKNQSVRSKEFDLPPPLKDPNEQKHFAGAGIDSYINKSMLKVLVWKGGI